MLMQNNLAQRVMPQMPAQMPMQGQMPMQNNLARPVIAMRPQMMQPQMQQPQPQMGQPSMQQAPQNLQAAAPLPQNNLRARLGMV